MKIVVIGDIVVPCELLVEAAKHLDSHAEVVAVEWPNASRQEFQHRAQNLEKNGPTAEKVPARPTSRSLTPTFCSPISARSRRTSLLQGPG